MLCLIEWRPIESMPVALRIFRSSASGALLALMLAVGGGPVTAQQSSNAKLTVRSHVPGLKITLLSKLPKAPETVSPAEMCGPPFNPKSEGGKVAAALGWGVTAEAQLGTYQAVSFAGGFENAASGTCEISGGNVAIFSGGQLVAVIYADKSGKASIGRISMASNGLRILDGDLVPMPVGDVRLTSEHAIEVLPLANEEPVCDGRGIVPNIYGRPVIEARKAVIARGWKPFRSPPSSYPDHEGEDLRKDGIVEATGCVGTGLAFCSYYYRNGDMELGVTSVGDGKPTVSAYDIACEPSKWHKAD